MHGTTVSTGCSQPNANIRRRGQLEDEVLRHAVRERIAPDEQRDLLGVLGQVERRLPGGVARANHAHRTASHRPGLTYGGTVDVRRSFLYRAGGGCQ